MPFSRRVARFQYQRPFVVLLLVLCLTLGLGSLGRRLTVAAGFEHLLPEGRASVVELNRVSKQTAGVSTLFVVLESPEGSDKKKLRQAADALAVDLRALGEPWVGSADSGVQETVRYLEARAGLYADEAELAKLHKEVKDYVDYQAAKELDTLIDDSEPPPPEPVVTPEAMRRRFGIDESAAERFPDGYYESADGRVHVVTIRSKILGGDLDRGTEALRRVREVVEKAGLDSYAPGIKVGYAGDLYSGIAEVTAINKDVTEVGILGGILLAGVVLVYYLRLRNLILMLGSVAIGLLWTAGVAYLLVHQLNTATGFVFTIIAGNGINTAIIFMARYLEARKKGEAVEHALGTAHGETFMATLCAAVAAAASFLSLQTTAFRGFRELGLIGGVGLVLCWSATLIALPSMLTLVERVSPSVVEKPGLLRRIQGSWEASFGRPFAFLIERAPRALALAGLLVGLGGFVALGFYIKADPFEYDMHKLRNDPRSRAEEERVRTLAIEATGYVGADGMAILVDRPEQVAPLRAALYERRHAAPPELKPFDSVVALEDFVPSAQEAKIPILLELKKLVVTAKKFKKPSDEEWAQVARFLPPDDLSPVTLASLPEGLARTFTEVDGTRGRIVYIVPVSPESTEDARYLLRWADAYRRTELPDKSVVLGSGRAVIYADMWEAVMASIPVAVIAAFLAVALVVLLTFRAGRAALLVIGSLVLGMGWMAIGLIVFGVKLNFLNFVALPITFGIGVDYAVNVVWRASREKKDGALIAVRETGGAVVLASLTTMLGYLALVGSMNFAVKSLGVAAVIGEVSALLPAMLVLPAAMHWWERRKAGQSGTSVASAPVAVPVSAASSAASDAASS